MFNNKTNIKITDFENICRTCLFNKNLKQINDNVISDFLQRVTNIIYAKNDKLPQKLCENCIQKLNEFQIFTKQCNEIDVKLKNCLTRYENEFPLVNDDNLNSVNEEKVEIKNEIIDDQDKTNFIEVNNIKIENLEFSVSQETQYNELFIKSETDETNKELFEQNLVEDITIDVIPNHYLNEDSTAPENKNKEFNMLQKNRNNKKNVRQKVYPCVICNKTFTQSSHHKKHQMVHNGERPYQCDLCTKAFTQSYNLIRHKLVHTGERPYQCQICFKTFSDVSNLSQHKWVHSTVRRFQCDECPKSFSNSRTLKAHTYLHRGESPYQCHICNKTLMTSGNLAKHMRVHKDECP